MFQTTNQIILVLVSRSFVQPVFPWKKKKDFLFTASGHGIPGSSFGIAPLHLPIRKKKTLPVDGYWLVINNYGL